MGVLLLVLLAFQGAPSAAPQDQTAQTASLSGTIVDSISGAPVNKAILNLVLPDGTMDEVPFTSSDASGKFAFSGLKPGQYQLLASRSGYVRMFYNARGTGRSGAVLRMEAGQSLHDIQFRLAPASAIAGTLRDSDGDPVEGAEVEIGRVVYDNRGKMRLQYVGQSSTDDRGEYRFHGLAPGKYYISAAQNGSQTYGTIDRSARRGPEDVEVLTFYPSAPDVSSALAVEASAGRRVEGIDLRMLKVHAVCVRGRVIAQANRTSVSLEADLKVGNGIEGKFRANTSVRDAEGNFLFCGVPSGSYVLSAVVDGASVQRSLDVGSTDVDDLRLSPEAGGSVQLHVASEGEAKADLSRLQVEVFQGSGTERASIGGFQSRGGSATLDHQRPGHYDVDVTSVPRGFYVKSIRSGSIDVLADGFTLPGGGTLPVEITLSPDGASLSGVVLDKDQNPVPGATVLVAPANRTRYDLFVHAVADQNGRYEFDAVTPGSYKLLALDDVETNAWNDPDFLRPYEKQAMKADLEPKGKLAIDLKIAVAPDAP